MYLAVETQDMSWRSKIIKYTFFQAQKLISKAENMYFWFWIKSFLWIISSSWQSKLSSSIVNWILIRLSIKFMVFWCDNVANAYEKMVVSLVKAWYILQPFTKECLQGNLRMDLIYWAISSTSCRIYLSPSFPNE